MRWKVVRCICLLLLSSAVLTGCSDTSEAVSDQVYQKEMDEYENYAGEEFIEEQYEAARENFENIYYNVIEEVSKEDGMIKGSGTRYLYGVFLRVYLRIREAAPFIIGISIFTGVLIAFMSRENKKLRRFAILWMIIIIPLATLAVVWGVAMTPLFRYK